MQTDLSVISFVAVNQETSSTTKNNLVQQLCNYTLTTVSRCFVRMLHLFIVHILLLFFVGLTEFACSFTAEIFEFLLAKKNDGQFWFTPFFTGGLLLHHGAISIWPRRYCFSFVTVSPWQQQLPASAASSRSVGDTLLGESYMARLFMIIAKAKSGDLRHFHRLWSRSFSRRGPKINGRAWIFFSETVFARKQDFLVTRVGIPLLFCHFTNN